MPSKLNLDSVVQIADGVVSARVAGEIVILNPETERYFGVEGTGVDIWESLSTPRRVLEIRDLLLESYEVDQARCENDLLGILEGMADDGLIEAVEP